MTNQLKSAANKNKEFAAKLTFDVLLAEYGVCRNLIIKNREFQSQLTNMALTSLGLSIPLISFIKGQSSLPIGIILALPILFFAICFVQFWHEKLVNTNAIYIDEKLRPKLNQLLSSLDGSNISVLEYEGFNQRSNWMYKYITIWLSSLTRAGISGLLGLGFIILYLSDKNFIIIIDFNNFETILLLVDTIMLLVLFFVSIGVSRDKYKYHRRNYSKDTSKSAKEKLSESSSKTEQPPQL